MGILGKIFGGLKKANHSQQQQRNHTPPPQQRSSQWVDPRPPSKNLTQDLRDVFMSYLPGFEIFENIAVTEIDSAAEFGGPIDFVLVKDGAVKGVVMIITNKRNKRFWGVEKACVAKGIPLMNFYRHQWFTSAGAVNYMSKFI